MLHVVICPYGMNSLSAQQPKRKEKEPKRRKSKALALPPSASFGVSTAVADHTASEGSSGGVSTSVVSAVATAVAQAAAQAASTSVANACCTSSNADKSHPTSAQGSPIDCSDGLASTSVSHGSAPPIGSGGSARLKKTTGQPSSRQSSSRVVTESRQIQAAALTRALNSLQGTGSPSKGIPSVFPVALLLRLIILT